MEAKSDRRAMGCLILFAIPFAGSGVFVGYLAISMALDWMAVMGWQEVPARIHSVELIENTGGDSVTYSVDALYEYHFRGETYQADRVTLSDSSDNIGSFHQDVYRELARYQESEENFRCFVNPDEPAESILYRNLRWGLFGLELVFALVFGGVGFGLIIAAFVGGRIVKQEEGLKAAHPDQPWQWRRDWAGGRIRSGSKTQAIFFTIFATLWILMSLPPTFLIWDEVAQGNHLVLLVLLFPTIGVVMAIGVARLWIRYFKFSQSTFEMTRFPGVLGGLLRGHILTGMKEPPERGARLTLSCVRQVTTGSGKNRSTSERVLWQETDLVDRGHLAYTPRGWRIPVELGVPYDAGPPSSPEDDDDTIFWRLEADAEVRGIDFETDFKVPIFLTPDSDPEFEWESREESAFMSEAELEEDLLRAGIRMEVEPGGGKRIVIGRARNKGAATALTAFLAVWTGAILLMIRLGAPIFLTAIFSFFGVLVLFGALDMWLTKRLIQANRAELVYSRGMLSSGRQRILPRDEIISIKPVRGMQSGGRLFYKIEAQQRGGKKHTLATQIGSLRLAKRLVGEIGEALGDWETARPGAAD